MAEMNQKTLAKDEGDQQHTLPKNIRQIGEPDKKCKIYVEDYAVTYVHQASCGILLGETRREKTVRYDFINSAMEVDKERLTQENWSEIEGEAKECFPGKVILGWFLGGDDEPLLQETDVARIQQELFRGEGQLFLYALNEEREEEIFRMEGEQLCRQKGHYIYYDKNPQMQEYLVGKNKGKSVEKETQVDDDAIHSFRKMIEEKQEKVKNVPRFGKIARAGGMLLVVAAIVLGVTVISNYDKVQETVDEKSAARVSAEISTGEAETASITRVLETESETAETMEETETGLETQTEAMSEEMTEGMSEELPSNAAATMNRSTQATYIVKEGDTLATVCRMYYGDLERLDEICELNAIEDENLILPGQKIVLP